MRLPRFNQVGLWSVGWAPTPDDREIAEQVVGWIATKRVLTSPLPEEEPAAVMKSAFETRQHLAGVIGRLPRKSELRQWLDALQSLYAELVTAGGQDGSRFCDDIHFAASLYDLRTGVAELIELAQGTIGLTVPRTLDDLLRWARNHEDPYWMGHE